MPRFKLSWVDGDGDLNVSYVDVEEINEFVYWMRDYVGDEIEIEELEG